MKFNLLIIFWSCLFVLTANNRCASSVNEGNNEGIVKELKDNESAIPLPYNAALDNTVKQLAEKNLPKTFTKYEAFIDSALVERNIPMEVKYLPYALSGMDSCYSKGDRIGYWALPTLVGMHYGLRIDDNCDERQSVEFSTIAALNYLSDLHLKYDDWWYSILAYANSPTSLSHALIHHGDKPELWDFYEQKLMPDTYVIPNFIACVYLGNQDLLVFNNDLPASPAIAQVIEPAETQVVEPVETKVVETVETKPVEPTETKVVEPEETKVVEAAETKPVVTKPATENASSTIRYKIKWGDTLWGIATKHHVSVEQLKAWNNLKSDAIYEGNYLIIKKQ